jgi:phage-related protein/predicted XRE-type DNA-binding protein
LVQEKPEPPRKLVWLVDSLDRLTRFPPSVRQKLGFALYQAQIGQKHESAEILHGFAETVWQVRADGPAGTYGPVYVAQFREAGYVLHAFQKKAISGIATPQRELDLIRQRLHLAQASREARKLKMPNRESTPSSGNVFADLDLPDADDLLAKADLAGKIIGEIQRRRITQAQAAEILRIDQPKISALKQGKLSGFSVERLMRFLLLLGRDIEIAVKDKPRSRPRARLRVA